MSKSFTRAAVLLSSSRHAAMATVNADGSPHNTPYFFVRNPDLTKLYWRSRPESMHSQNIARTGELFVVLFTNNDHPTGLYIRAHNGRVAQGSDFGEGVAAFNAAQEKAGYQQFTAEEYASNPSKLYVADIQEMWINGFELDEKGMVTRDFREVITAQDLLR